MGKRKHSEDSEVYRMKKKLRKLEKKIKRRSRRLSSSSTASETPPPQPLIESVDNDVEIEDVFEDSSEQVVEASVEENLDPEVLLLLGDDDTNLRKFGDNLHKDLVSRWQNILLKGLTKEERLTLAKTHLPPENCSALIPPKLNLEVKAAITDVIKKKDTFSETKQSQLSSSLSAIGTALNIAFTNSEKVPRNIIKPLSDASRLLCDVYYKETCGRRYAIINTLNRQVKDTVKNTKVDEYLFGSDLSEHLRSSKVISKSGLELKQGNFNRIRRNVPAAGPSQQQQLQSQPPTFNAKGGPRRTASAPRPNPAYRRQRDQRQEPSTSRHRANYRSRRR